MFAVIAATAAPAFADGEVGVVVTGDVVMQPQVATFLERWWSIDSKKVLAGRHQTLEFI